MKGKTGSRMPRADVDELLGLEVDLPKSLDEQEQIADVIEARYKAIEIAKSSCLRQIELLDTLAKRTLQECLATN